MKQTNTKTGSAVEYLKFSSEQQKLIEEMAGMCFTPEEIAIAIDMDWLVVKQEFKKPGSQFYKLYKKGALLHMLHVRKSIYDLAKGGSSASQAEYLRLRKESDTFLSKHNL
jgi:hypothetical protein